VHYKGVAGVGPVWKAPPMKGTMRRTFVGTTDLEWTRELPPSCSLSVIHSLNLLSGIVSLKISKSKQPQADGTAPRVVR